MKAQGITSIDFEWDRDDEEFPGRLWARPAHGAACALSINGLSMHVYALRVTDDDGVQQAWDDSFASEVDALQRANGANFQTVALDGHEGYWIIVLLPHGD